MSGVLLSLVVVLLFACYNNPRLGIYITLAVGFLADPVRKLLPGQPVFIVGMVAVFAGVTFLGALNRRLIPPLRSLLARSGRLRTPIVLFLFLVVVESTISFARTGSPVIAGIGLIAYLAPAPAILLGYGALRTERSVLGLILFYSAFAGLFASGIFLSALGWEHPLLSAVGEELVAYSAETGQSLQLLCGFFRASEIAAWHCAVAACLMILLATAFRKRPLLVFLAGAASVYFFIAIVFTGRRKAFVAMLLFSCVFGFLLVRYRRGAPTLARVFLAAILGMAILGQTSLFSENFASRYQAYLAREKTTTARNAMERVQEMVFDAVGLTVQQNGFFGAGAGAGSQGSQHFGGGTDIVGGSAEGGLAKVLAELGIPGIAVILWIGVLMVRRVMRAVRQIRRSDSIRAVLCLGLIALLATNTIEFVTAHQAFGDPFVLFMLGWMLGLVLALLRQEQEIRAAARPAPERPRRLPVAPGRPILGIEGLDA